MAIYGLIEPPSFSDDQWKLVHKEILELHIYYHSMMPCLSKKINKEMDGLIRDMVVRFEDDNPYIVSAVL